MLSKSPRFDNSKEEESRSVLGDRRVSCIPKSGLFFANRARRHETRQTRDSKSSSLSLPLSPRPSSSLHRGLQHKLARERGGFHGRCDDDFARAREEEEEEEEE